jgi:DNA invertase Pin-like site-specific DNA recombinase
MQVALYGRVSTKGGRQDTENQLAQLREYCARQAWEIRCVDIDQVSGATTAKRTEFRRMMEAARQRRFDLLLFWSLDRFSREGVSAILNHLERLSSYGVDWRSYTEQYLDSLGPFRDA